MKTALVILVLACTLSCRVNREPVTSADQVNLLGTWLAQTESLNGVSKIVPFIYVFSKDEIKFTDETGKETVYLYKLDTAGPLKFLLLRPADSPADATPVSVGYELHGDVLKIVIAPPGLRPSELSDKNDQELIICRRKAP